VTSVDELLVVHHTSEPGDCKRKHDRIAVAIGSYMRPQTARAMNQPIKQERKLT